MSNVISKTDIVNIARTRAQLELIDDIDGATDADARKSRLILREVEDLVLRMFPWKHAAKRVELQNIGQQGNPSYEYQYRYQLPADYAYIWQLYPEGGYDTAHWGRYYENLAYIYYAGGFVGGTFDLQNLGEIIGDEFQSNVFPMYCLYTARGPVDYSKVDPQFVDVMKVELMKRFIEMKGLGAEEYTALNRNMRAERKEAKKLASIQNREAHSVSEPQIVQTLSRAIRGRRGYR